MISKSWTNVAICATFLAASSTTIAFAPLPLRTAANVNHHHNYVSSSSSKTNHNIMSKQSSALYMAKKKNSKSTPSNDSLNNSSNNKSSSSPDDSTSSSSPSYLDKKEKELEKKVRIAQAREKIDRILKSPDAPFDVETELQKVVSISPGLPPDSEEQITDDELGEIESQLYAAIDRQDFVEAQNIQKEISQMHIDDCGSILQVNSNFYKAFSEKDYDAMERIWLKDASITCIHPSHAPLVGAKAVLQSWKHMFESTDGSFQKNWMEPSGMRLVVKGSTAILTCDEEVFARRFVRGSRRQTEIINKLTATNIFRKMGGTWYMVHHHASWHADSDAAKVAFNQNTGVSSSTGAGGNSVPTRIVLRGKGGDGSSTSSNSGSDVGSADGILGMPGFGPLLGDGAPQQSDSDRPANRIIMGSLSDILGGGLGDILGGVGQEGGSDGNENGDAIIQFTNIEDDDGNEDDDNEDDDDDDGDDHSEAISIIKEWANKSDNAEVVESNSSSPTSSSSSSNGNNIPKDALRQNCISTLRKLCEQGSISPKQKRVLLTDIITCSAKGEFSTVEVAYELLCGEGEDMDIAEEEFSEQCRVFAASLSE